MTKLTLPTDSDTRKGVPLYSGCYTYFPAALAGVAIHSRISNEKHNPGEPLHHSRGKSGDHADCIARHSMDIADMLARRALWTMDEQKAILTESRALSWRALAWAQEIEEMFGAPLAPAARAAERVTAPDAERTPPAAARSNRSKAYFHTFACRDYDCLGRCWPDVVSHDSEKSPVAALTGCPQPVVQDGQYAREACAHQTSTPEKSQAYEVDLPSVGVRPYHP